MIYVYMTEYGVVVCSDCEWVMKVDMDTKTKKCPTCGTQHQLKNLKKYVVTDSNQKADVVMAELRYKLQNETEDDEEFDFEIRDDGVIVTNETSGFQSMAERERKQNQMSDDEARDVLLELIDSMQYPLYDDVVSVGKRRDVDEKQGERLMQQLFEDGVIAEDENGKLVFCE